MKKGKMKMSGRRVLAFLLTAMMCMTLLPTNVFAAVMGTRYPNVRIVFSDGKTNPSSGYASETSFTYDTLSGTTVKSPSSYYSIAGNYTFSHYSCRDGGGMGTSSVSQPGDWWNPSGTIYMDIYVKEDSTGKLPGSGSSSGGGSTTSGSHSVNVNFRIVYLDNDEFNLGYNYGNTYSTTFNCQYSNCSTTNSYSNHCIALNDIGAAKNYMTNNGYVNSGWEIVGWGKDAKRNMSYSTTWTGTGYGSGGTTCQNNGYIEIVAKKKASYTIFINCYDQNNNLIYSTQENDKYAGDYYYVTAPSVSGYTKTGTTSYSGTMPDSDKTFNFYYQSNVQNVTVTYIDRTMLCDKETKTLGSQFTVKDCTNTRGSYDFIGWSETNGATTVDYEVGDGFVPTSDVTLYAVWQLKKVKLTYNADNGTSATNTQEYAKGTNVTLKNANALGFTRSGYKFLGWNTSSGATTATYTAGSNLLLNSDATLYAVWQKVVTTVEVPVKVRMRFEGLTAADWDNIKAYLNGTETNPKNAQGGYYQVNSCEKGTEIDGTPYVEFAKAHGYSEWVVELDKEYTINYLESNPNVKGYHWGGIKNDSGEYVTTLNSDKKAPYTTKITFAADDVTNGRAIVITNKYYHNVKWVDENGTELKNDTFTDYNNIPEYGENPTKQDDDKYTYKFKEWVRKDDTETGDVVFTASYTTTPKTYDYKMTYKLDGGKYNDNTADVVKEEKAQTAESYTFDALSPAPVKEGYTFKGWNGSLTVTKDSPNGEVTAVWEPKTYTVKWLDDDEKTVLDSDTFKTGENEPAYDEETPSKDDDDDFKYEFTGWSEPKKDTDGNITYVAQYTKTAIKKFTVTYTDGVDDEVIFEDDVHSNLKEGSATPKFTKTLSRKNYTFVDWSPSVAETVTENVTYVAQWKANTHKVTWVDENGDTIKEITVEDKDTTGVPEGQTPGDSDYTIPEDKEFDKWEEQEPDENGDIVIKLILKDKVVEPPTPVKANYTVEWYEIGVAEPIKTETTRKGEVGTEVSVTDEDKTVEGYTFDEENLENVLSAALDESGTVLKLYFTANTHKVIWVTPDGEEIESRDDVRDGTEVDEKDYPTPPTPPEGKEFGGWGEPETDPETGDVTITVIWKDKEKTYTLSYDANEGTGAPAQQSETTTEDSVTFTVANGEPQREGYTFEGWTGNLLAGNPLYIAGEEITISEDTTLYAVWTKNAESEKTHSVTWKDGYTDTPIKTLTDVKENEDITDKYPEEPKRDGYSFDGWNEPETDSEGNVTITAKWKEDNSGDNNNGGSNRPTGGGGNSNRPGRTPGGTGITNGGGLTEILDENVPLADVPDLNNTDHFAYIIGYEDGLVRPENNISRAEVATIFFRLMTDLYRSENWATSNNYSDVKVGQWFNNAVSTGTTAGILTGYEDGTFLPEQMITRAEFATMAVRFLSGDAAPIVSFNDIDGHWAADNILKAAAVGWINGYEDGSFRPDQPITRAETATLVNRMLNRDPKGGMLDDMVKWPDNPEDAWYYSAIQEATNGHDYVTGAEGETWTSMLANRDWSELEK